MSEDTEYRFINKSFLCSNCGKREKKLVRPTENQIHCSVCDSNSYEINVNPEFNRDYLDRTYRIVFNHNGDLNRNQSEYHNRTDIFDRNPNNVFADPREHVVHLSQQEIDRRNLELINRARQRRLREIEAINSAALRAAHRIQVRQRHRDRGSSSDPDLINSNHRNNSLNLRVEQNNINNDINNNQNEINHANNNANINNENINNENLHTTSFRSQQNPSHVAHLANENSQSQPINIPIGAFFGIPFIDVQSPFSGSVNHHDFDHRFDDFFRDFFFIQPSDQFFRDNYASNFSSNFPNPFSRIIFITMVNHDPENLNQPATAEALQRLKRFKMSEEYSKKGQNETVEFPSCSICLTEINLGEDSILVPCGHIYHDPCIMKCFEVNNKCPVCRYELRDNRDSFNNNSTSHLRRSNENERNNTNVSNNQNDPYFNVNQENENSSRNAG